MKGYNILSIHFDVFCSLSGNDGYVVSTQVISHLNFLSGLIVARSLGVSWWLMMT